MGILDFIFGKRNESQKQEKAEAKTLADIAELKRIRLMAKKEREKHYEQKTEEVIKKLEQFANEKLIPYIEKSIASAESSVYFRIDREINLTWLSQEERNAFLDPIGGKYHLFNPRVEYSDTLHCYIFTATISTWWDEL